MRIISVLAIMLAFGLLQGCSDMDAVDDGSGYIANDNRVVSQAFDRQASQLAFSTTVYPITAERCVDCHRPDGAILQQPPFHAHTDHTVAHDAVLVTGKVNFSDIPNSRLITRLKEGSHYCWSEDCNADADEMQAAIEAWAAQIDTAAAGSEIGSEDEVVADDVNTEEGSAADSGIPGLLEGVFDRQASAVAFSTTVHPITLEQCADCHRPNGNTLQQAPFHAHTDYTIAHEAVVDTARVDFSNIPNSRLILRLREDSHYCWSGDCSADADEMQAAIEAWVSQIDTSGVAEVRGARTQTVGITAAEIRIPESINRSIVMQAESATLSGRFTTKQSSQASDFLYIGTDFPPVHPIEGTARVPSVNFNGQGCTPPTAADLQDTVTGPFRLREDIRHVDQTGYRYYSQLVQVRFIRPHLRDEFRQAVLNGDSGPQLDRFYITFGGPEDDNNFDGVLDGNTITRNVVRLLPEFRDVDFFNNTLHGDNAEANRDFFAPRFGSSGTEFWSANDNELRANLVDTLKRGPLYNQVIDRYRRWFFDFDRNADDWVAQNRLRDVPFTLRRLLDTDGTPFEENNLTSSQAFYDYYLGGLTRENALDMVGGMPRIDSYVYYFIDPANRAFGNFNQDHREIGADAISRDNFRLDRGDVNLDLANLYTGGTAKDLRTIHIDNYADIVKPIFATNSCIQCHGDGSNRPQFSQNDNNDAYDAAASIADFFNTSNPRQSRPVQRLLDDRHNCNDNATCDNIGNMLIQAITDWTNQNAADQLAAQNSADTGLVELSVQERTPGRAKFNIKITDAGVYNVWLKLRTNAGNANSFFVRVVDAQGNPVNGIGNGDGSNTSESCKRFDQTTNGDWDWYTASIDNIDNRIKWNLGVGDYVLEVVEREVGAELDMIAISSNPEFNPAKNLIDESNIQSNNPKILVFSLEEYIGQGQFEIEVKEDNTSDAYIFRNPRFRGINSNLRFSDIKILVNDQYEFSNSTYTKLNRVVDGMDSGILTTSPMLALMLAGPGVDVFSFVFGDLTLTDQPVDPLDDDAPVPINGRECQNLDLFTNTVMPILNNFKLMMKEDYDEYAAGNFPGTDGDGIANPTVYNCTTCHTEEHPYFKMTTFAEGLAAGEPIPQDGLEELCSQALSRVDYGNFDRSLLLRGLNGTFNHPKLHFIQKVGFSGSGNTRSFVTNTNDPSGYQSEFIGLRFDKWSADDLNLNSYVDQDRRFLERYVGRYQQIRYERYQNGFSLNDGVIMTENDVVINPGTSSEDLDRRDGPNRYTVINPVNELNSFANMSESDKVQELNRDPINNNAPWKIKDSCIGVDFNNSNGILSDPCNSNVNVVTEFESVKQNYREAIINWMNEEKMSYDIQNN